MKKQTLLLFVFFVLSLVACGGPGIKLGAGGGDGAAPPQVRVVNNVFVFDRCEDEDGDAYRDCSFIEQCDARGLSPERREQCRAAVRNGGVQLDGVATNIAGLRGGDCDDARADVYPGAPELCDGADNDCDGAVDNGAVACGCVTNADCGDALFCNGVETCVGTATSGRSCRAGAAPCVATSTTPLCDEQADQCVACLVDADCGDGAFCNGAERCVGGVCGTGTPPCSAMSGFFCLEDLAACQSCDDWDACTTDTVGAAGCVNTPVSGCCRGPADDAACAASRPSGLAMEYLWGCSTSSTATTTPTGFVCTTCADQDGDGICAADEICGNGLDDDGDGLVDEAGCVTPGAGDAGVSADAGAGMDTGAVMMDAGVADDATAGDAGAGCASDRDCGPGEFCAGGACVMRTDQRGRTPYGASGANGGPQPDGTPDCFDDDGDGYCEVSPCCGSRNPSLARMSLLGGDCDDNPADSPPSSRFTVTTAAGAFQTDGSFANHPGATEWCEQPPPGYDNDCDGTPNDGC